MEHVFRWIVLLGCSLLIAFGGVFSQERGISANASSPAAALLPLSSMGMEPAQSQILFNQLLARLSEDYALVSQAEVDDALQKAFSTLKGEQCTEENCLVLLQEYLRLDLVFNLQIILDRQTRLTQLTLTAINQKRRFIKTEKCDGCDLNGLLNSLDRVTDRLLAQRDEFQPMLAKKPGIIVSPLALTVV